MSNEDRRALFMGFGPLLVRTVLGLQEAYRQAGHPNGDSLAGFRKFVAAEMADPGPSSGDADADWYDEQTYKIILQEIDTISAG